MNHKGYIRYTWIVLGMVFLVIMAGAVVRMTQSGMGCPDWPKCFGRWIPPVNERQLPPDFEKYLDKQDIDHSFNVYHTWIEYINRLLGALLGLFILVHTVWSFKAFRKKKPSILYLSLFMLVAVIFQAWLGKLVVDANLAVAKVTAHMVGALVIAAIPVIIISRLREKKLAVGSDLKSLALISIIVVLIQVVFGTAVREQIDEISKSLSYGQREVWIGMLDNDFLLHRSFSWVIALVIFFLAWRSRIYPGLVRTRMLVLLALLGSFFSGLTMYFFAVPALAQPIHLLTASILLISLVHFRMQLR